MGKKIVLIVFDTIDQSKWYFENNIKPFVLLEKEYKNIVDLKGNFKVVFSSLDMLKKGNLRGYAPHLIYLVSHAELSEYNQLLNLVSGNHEKICVVM